jgi:hypothetical protein
MHELHGRGKLGDGEKPSSAQHQLSVSLAPPQPQHSQLFSSTGGKILIVVHGESGPSWSKLLELICSIIFIVVLGSFNREVEAAGIQRSSAKQRDHTDTVLKHG